MTTRKELREQKRQADLARAEASLGAEEARLKAEAEAKAKSPVEQPVVTEKKKGKSKAQFTDPNTPPTVPDGKRAIWHKGYSYKNAQGTEINMAGHWEIINKAVEKTKPAAPAATEAAK